MRAVEDDHVDRPDVEVQQCIELTGTNRSIGLIDFSCQPLGAGARHPIKSRNSKNPCAANSPYQSSDDRAQMTALRRCRPRRCSAPAFNLAIALSSVLCSSPAWWLWRGRRTRSHPELGRENPQRRWYCVLRRGRVGRRQVFDERKPQHQTSRNLPHSAGQPQGLI